MRQYWVVKVSGPQSAPHFRIWALSGCVIETPDSTIRRNTSALMPTRTVVTGMRSRAADRRREGRVFCEGDRARIAARHSGQMFNSPAGTGAISRPQLTQAGMGISYVTS